MSQPPPYTEKGPGGEQPPMGYPPAGAPPQQYPPPGQAYPPAGQPGYPPPGQPGYGPPPGQPGAYPPPGQPGAYPPPGQPGAYPPGQPAYAPQPGYQGQPGGMPATTVVVAQPGITVVQTYHEAPVRTRCTVCGADIITAVSYEVGTFTWVICLILCFFVGIFGLIPFCCDSCKDTVHHCPNCQTVLGRYRRM